MLEGCRSGDYHVPLLAIVLFSLVNAHVGRRRRAVCDDCRVAAAYTVGVKSGLLHGYKLERINVILDPENRRQARLRLSTWQSMVTVGEGGLTGARSSEYSQSSLKFLPEPHTDFILRHRGNDWVRWLLTAAGFLCLTVTRLITDPAAPATDRHAGDHGDRRRTDFSDFHYVRHGPGLLPRDRACRCVDERPVFLRTRHFHRDWFRAQRTTAPVRKLAV